MMHAFTISAHLSYLHRPEPESHPEYSPQSLPQHDQVPARSESLISTQHTLGCLVACSTNAFLGVDPSGSACEEIMQGLCDFLVTCSVSKLDVDRASKCGNFSMRNTAIKALRPVECSRNSETLCPVYLSPWGSRRCRPFLVRWNSHECLYPQDPQPSAQLCPDHDVQIFSASCQAHTAYLSSAVTSRKLIVKR